MNKKIIISTVTLTMLISLFTMCKKDEPEITIGNIQVVVKDYENNEAISEALISLSGMDKVFNTDFDGECSISDIEKGYYDITVSKTAYVSEMSNVEVKAGQTNTVYFELKKEKPKLKITPEELDFGTDKKQMFFTLTNENTKAKMDWKIITPNKAKWLSISKLEGSLLEGDEEIKVSVDRNKMSEAKVYTTYLKIESSNGGGSARIKVKVEKKEEIKLSIEPSSLDFAKDYNVLDVKLRNLSQNKTIDYKATSSKSWITIDNNEGSINVNDYSRIRVRVDRSGLSKGTYSDEIKIVANGKYYTIPVSMTVSQQVSTLSISKNYLDFGTQYKTYDLKLRNTSSSEAIYYKATSNNSWIELSNNYGTIYANGSKNLNIKVDRTGLSSGQYNGKIYITANQKNYVVNVKMTVEENAATLQLETNSLNFGTQYSTYDLKLSNTSSSEAIYYEATSNKSWIELSNNYGTIYADGSRNLNIKVDRTGLSSGQYNGKIHITANQKNYVVNVKMTVKESTAVLRLETGNLNFGTKYSSYNLTLSNPSSTESIYYEARSNKTWLTLSNSSGTIYANGSTKLGIQVDRSGLSPGQYSGTIYVTANQKIHFINVKMTVEDQGSSTINSKVKLEGNLGYTIKWGEGRVNMRVDKIINRRPNGYTGTLKLQLRMGENKFQPGVGSSYVIGEYKFKHQLEANEYFYDVDRTVNIVSYPPNGIYYVTMVLLEYDDGEYYVVDYFTFKNTINKY